MKVLKLVHTADLHIGSHFSSTPEISAKRKFEQMQSLRDIIKICHEKDASVLLIAGDLFDCVRVEPQLLSEVQSILGESGLRVFISPGNHDPATPDSSYLSSEWPENVHIFTGDLECVEIPESNAYIWGLGFRHSHEMESLLGEFTPYDGKINVLMMHSEVVSDTSPESRYNPITHDRLVSLGVDYCALGHIHKPTSVSFGERMYCSPGCPSARGFDEPGVHGVYAGYVGYNFTSMNFVPLNCRRYYVDKIDVSGCEVVSDFVTRITTALQKTVGSDYCEHIYDITLCGALSKGIMPDTPAIAKVLMDELHYIRLTDITTTELDIDTLMRDNTLRGSFVRTIVDRMEQDDRNRDLYLRALLYGLRAFDGEVKVNEDY